MCRATTYHGLVRNGLNEGVEDFRKRVRRHACPPNGAWILVHASLPVVAHRLQRRRPRRRVTPVFAVVLRAHGHLGQNVGNGLFGFLIDVGADGGPEGVDDVNEEEHEEDVEEELCVEGEDVGEGGVCLDEAE